MPRSPRATMMQSATRTMSSARATACGFSIFAISGMRVCSRTWRMSSGRRTKLSATRSTPIFDPGAQVLEVLLGHGRELVGGPGDVEALARGDDAAELDLAVELARLRRASAMTRRRTAPSAR